MCNLQSKINKHSVLFFILFFGVGAAYAEPTQNFQSFFELIQKNDPHLVKMRAEVEAAEARQQATGSAFWPKLGFESKYETFESDFEKVKGGTSHAFLDWNLFRGFQDYSVKSIANNDLSIQQNNLQRYESNLKWKMLSLFQKAVSLQSIVDLYDQALQQNQKFLQTVKIRKNAGLISEADLYEFDLYENELKLERSDFEAQLDELMSDLKSLSGQENLKFSLALVAPKKIQIQMDEIKKQLASPQSSLEAYRIAIQSADSQKYVAIGKMLPEVNLKLTYGSLGLRDTEVTPETAFAIVARWEIFSGFETSSAYRVAITEKAEAEANFSQQKIHVLSRVEQLKKRFDIIWSRLDLEDQNQQKSAKYFKAVQTEYQRGVKNSADLKSAHATVLANSISILKLKAEYFEIRSELQEILGYELKEIQ